VVLSQSSPAASVTRTSYDRQLSGGGCPANHNGSPEVHVTTCSDTGAPSIPTEGIDQVFKIVIRKHRMRPTTTDAAAAQRSVMVCQ